ncbi:MAG: hypothetical protein JW895_04710 [Thermoleophilaceae bacterium]|nr:hypothetical protein [Thermoleophilaceae bacterium]
MSVGTSEDPLPADWYRGGASWREKYGEAIMWHSRPRVGPGDRIVTYAAGSAAQFRTGRIFCVVDVVTEPEPSGHSRWPWQVTTRMLVPGPRLPSCPTVDDIDVQVRSLRFHKSISVEQGREAELLIARAADRTGSLGHCYNGPPPPPGFEPGQS